MEWDILDTCGYSRWERAPVLHNTVGTQFLLTPTFCCTHKRLLMNDNGICPEHIAQIPGIVSWKLTLVVEDMVHKNWDINIYHFGCMKHELCELKNNNNIILHDRNTYRLVRVWLLAAVTNWHASKAFPKSQIWYPNDAYMITISPTTVCLAAVP